MGTEATGAGYSNRLTGLTAAGDLSSYQYHFVKLNDDNEVTNAGANERSIGILMNKPDAAGEEAMVAGPGEVAPLKMDEAVTLGKLITPTTNAQGEVVDAAGEWCGAIALQGASDGDIREVLVATFTAHASDA